MIKVSDIEKATMTESKRKEAHNNIFAFYIGRPISYVMTIPFLYTNITPNTITFISIILLIIGSGFFLVGRSTFMYVIGWVFFFLWNLFDGIDGNVARYKKQFSKTGDLWDTTAGYLAMVATYMAAGVGAYHIDSLSFLPREVYLILGGWTAIFSIFPRLILHKKKSSMGDTEDVKEFRDKNNFSLVKVIVLNLISITSFLQIIWLIAIVFEVESLFVIFYFIANAGIMLVTLYKLLK